MRTSRSCACPIANGETFFWTRWLCICLRIAAGRDPPAGFSFGCNYLPRYDSTALLPAAERMGLSYVPGARFLAGEGGKQFMRLAFSLLPPDELAEGVRRLEKLLRGVEVQ